MVIRVLFTILLVALASSARAENYKTGESAYKRGDYQTAIKHFRPLAERGHAKAQSNLGFMYENGYGVPQDYSTAVKWYSLVAEQGDADAQTAFRLANRAILLQRQWSYPDATDLVWRPFQLGFMLLTMSAIICDDSDEKAAREREIVDLLWFPTGGGKTEAYLGLIAFTLFLCVKPTLRAKARKPCSI